ncbi:MAG: RnfABCDGE type electron transport complex subunit D [candidate division WWE3 bacterium]|nr:RnfABCDGE type electron transport complex subunit D [candidate division WWE3 bacterium]
MWSKFLNLIDNFLNRITMYRLVLYVLIGLLASAVILGALGVVPYNPAALILSTSFILLISLITNDVFAKVFKAVKNQESVYITALILALIVSPITSFHDLIFLFWVSVLATAGKYILAIGKKHLFNPAAIAVVITAFGINQSASWWVGNTFTTPLVIIGGLLLTRKIRREKIVYTFIAIVVGVSLLFGLVKGSNMLTMLNTILWHSPLFFFAFVMLTEPITSPVNNTFQMIFAFIVGILFVPQIHVGSFYFTPELALVIGNVFAYFVTPKYKLVFNIKERVKTAADTFDFVFPLTKKVSYLPGQYMEWTLGSSRNDNRGNRRYFTLASSPTENNLRLGVKFYQPASSYKEALLTGSNATIVASQLAGDFVLPSYKNEKCVFIAGGIGVTPFRSMLKYLIDTNDKRDIKVIYANKKAEDIVYKDVFDAAKETLGIETTYTFGHVTTELIKETIKDYQDRVFYISGPQLMVKATKEALLGQGVSNHHIKTDFFPGFA